MGGNKHLWLTVLAVAAMLGLGGGLLVLPKYGQTASTNRRIEDLERKAANLDGQAEQLEALAAAVAEAERRIANDLKTIPPDPQMAQINERLSHAVDNPVVLDRNFITGQTTSATSEEGSTTSALPLTIDLVADFESVFSLLRTVEQMEHLVRVTSVKMSCGRTQSPQVDPPLTASVELEAIFDPSVQGEAR